MDYESMFRLDVPAVELFIRGSFMYLALFLAFRTLGRRESGSIHLSDLLVTVLIADAAQNAMAGEYKSITAGVILCGTILFWATLIDYLSFRFPLFRQVTEPELIPVVRNGEILWRYCRREHINEEDLLMQARKVGLSSLSEVEAMFYESNGDFTVIEKRKHSHRPPDLSASRRTP